MSTSTETYIFTRHYRKIFNTTILGPDGSIQYETITSKSGSVFKRNPTAIWRHDREGNRTKAAEIDWQPWSGDIVTFDGQPSIPAKEFLIKPSYWNYARDMPTPIGNYRWKEVKGQKPELFNASDHSVFHWTRNRHYLFNERPTAGNNPCFLVNTEIEPIMDHVLIGFLLMHEVIDRRKGGG